MKSLILAGAMGLIDKFLRANLYIPGYRQCICLIPQEAPRPVRVVLVPLVFDFLGVRQIHDVLVGS